jgi:hypothetical protein
MYPLHSIPENLRRRALQADAMTVPAIHMAASGCLVLVAVLSCSVIQHMVSCCEHALILVVLNATLTAKSIQSP